MSTCTFPSKGHSLIRFLIQVVLPEGRLEYSKVIKQFICLPFGVLYGFSSTEGERERATI